MGELMSADVFDITTGKWARSSQLSLFSEYSTKESPISSSLSTVNTNTQAGVPQVVNAPMEKPADPFIEDTLPSDFVGELPLPKHDGFVNDEVGVPLSCTSRRKHWRKRGRRVMGIVSCKSRRKVARWGTVS